MNNIINISFLNQDDPDNQEWKQLIQTHLNEYEVKYFDASEIPSHGRKILLVSGGDGSLNRAINRLMKNKTNKDLEILYFPNGTGNDFSRTVGLFQKSKTDILNLIKAGENTPIHPAKLDSQYFINMGSFGMFAEVTPEVDPQLKGIFGNWSYYFKGIEKLIDIQTFSIEFDIDDQTLSSNDCIGFFVANGRFSGGGVQISSEATPYDDELDLLIVKDSPLSKLIALGLELQKENPVITDFDVVKKRFKKLRFTSEQPISMSLDGEKSSQKNGEINLSRGSIQIITP